jgi:hypothetical protein
MTVGSRRRQTGPDQLTVEACLERAAFACEINGCDLRGNRGEGWSTQHRLPRGRGGDRNPRINLPSNLLIVCGSGTTGCHGLVEDQLRAASYEVGWLLHRCACALPFDCEHSPRKKPVLVLRSRWMLLNDDASYTLVIPQPAPVEPEEVPW